MELGRDLRLCAFLQPTVFEQGQPYTNRIVLRRAGTCMQAYQWGVIFIKFVVDFLLLFGGGRLSGDPANVGMCVLGALTGAAHSGLSMVRSLHFLGNPLWQGVGIIAMALVAYGLQCSTLRRGAVFTILSLALRGLGMGLGNQGIIAFLVAAGGLAVLCILGFRQNGSNSKYIPVTIDCGSTCLQLKALRDTGNTLCDPITGRPVLVIGTEAACRLTGLSREQLQRPVESVGVIPGLRLIPYRTVGCENGLMLARHYKNVSIGKWKGSSLVAFAPEGLNGDIEALTGGTA